ncbi:MAG: CinA family nicotinamide mononucleotide deamidase-related protein [Muribaculaceae bacterium]|nr:CinA family nicotinamide mononucleotide deamidase-related protein [Muribaculaceae bacterium]
MQYIILAIGDELLAGQVTDTNSGSIARILEPHGWELKRVETIADTAEALEDALDRALGEVNVVLTTGGLGPTKDDQTKQTLCRLFGASLRENLQVLENVKQVISRRNLRLNELTAHQALVPDNARIIQNEVGTAPILWFERPENRVVVCMPGVPFETVQMMERKVAPALIERFPEQDALVRHTVVAYDISESALAQILANWEDSLPSFAHLAYLPKPGIIRLRLDGHGPESIRPEMERLRRELISQIPPGNFLANGDITPEERLLQILTERHLTVSTAESCTGGTICARLCAIPGASDAMKGAVVAYSNEVKAEVLGVDRTDIERYGAVSQTVVEQMAAGVRKLTGSDFAVATSGIAGPGGGTAEKPVGTVWIATASPHGVHSECYHFPGTRDRVIDRAATSAIIALIRELSAPAKR